MVKRSGHNPFSSSLRAVPTSAARAMMVCGQLAVAARRQPHTPAPQPYGETLSSADRSCGLRHFVDRVSGFPLPIAKGIPLPGMKLGTRIGIIPGTAAPLA